MPLLSIFCSLTNNHVLQLPIECMRTGNSAEIPPTISGDFYFGTALPANLRPDSQISDAFRKSDPGNFRRAYTL